MELDFASIVHSKSTDELLRIFKEWHKYAPEMLEAVTEELDTRKVDLSDLIAEKENEIVEQETLLSKGKKGSPLYIIICFICAFLGGLLGLIGGYIYAFSKTRSYTGKAFYVYDEPTRKYGKIIITIGLIILGIALISKLSS